MNNKKRLRRAAFVLSLALCCLADAAARQGTARAEVPAPSLQGQEPVIDSMHQFMEYFFEPAYKQLKSSLAESPADKQAWKPVKGASLTLAEGGNLLLIRVPKEDGSEWRKLSVAVRNEGGELYQAARKADYEAARQHYVLMIEKCNVCHKRFADGKHQLEP